MFLLVEDSFESAQRRADLVIKRSGMKKITQDEQGVYRFEYYQVFGDGDGGFFSSMAFWRKNKAEDYSGAYQIYLEPDLFFSGVRPAVNVGISVSRVGGAAQIKAMKSVAGRLRLDLAQYRELEAFAQFGSDLDAATLRQLARGARTVEMLKQPQYQTMPVEDQVAVIYAVTNGYRDEVDVGGVRAWERGFHEHMNTMHRDLMDEMVASGKLSEDVEKRLVAAIEDYNEAFGAEERSKVHAASSA